MRTDARYARWSHILLLAGGLLAVSACEVMQQAREQIESQKAFVDHPGMNRYKAEATFDEVWPVVIEILEARGHEPVQTEQTSEREIYTQTVEVDDQPRNETLREKVTEKEGTIVATTEAGLLVPLELEEGHRWGVTTLDMFHQLGGDESWTLEHDGVEIAVSNEPLESLDIDEIEIAFAQMRKRFGE